MYLPRRSILNTAITGHMRRYDRNYMPGFSQEQSARQTSDTSPGGIQSVICIYRQPIIATSSQELTLAQRHAVFPVLP